jgi:hypothetical protein
VAKETLPFLARLHFIAGVLLVAIGFGQFLLVGGLEELGVLAQSGVS